MSAKSVITAVAGFLAHHVGDLTAIHSALSELVSVAPVDAQDKDRINSVLETIQSSANNINDFLNNTTLTGDSSDVIVKESDIVTALSNFFASDAGKAALASAVSTEGNANA